MPAQESKLGALHEALAQAYIDGMNDPDVCTAAFLSSAAKFLKDNNITCEAGDEQMGELKKAAGNILNFPFDAKEAQG